MQALAIIVLGLMALIGPAPSQPHNATCYTTDDGQYPCTFAVIDSNGSFEVSAPGFPSHTLLIDTPGIGWVYSTFVAGGRSVALPGPYVRSTDDPACWDNPDTLVSLCAW